ncbi:Sporulation domain-containing protein [Flammeovirgaceae bacterium 311]|nr:Sporulation domain-containing protein [Flammeovirgaceae bacterium 311]
MRSLPQAGYTNPAFVPTQTFYLGLPGISSVAGYGGSNSLSYQQVEELKLEDDFSGRSLLDLRAKMKDQNWFTGGAQVDLLSVGVRANARLYLRYRLSTKVVSQIMLPRGLALLADEQFLKTSNSITLAPSVQAMGYLENSFGASYVVNQKLTVGANIKRLTGLANVHTEHLDMTLKSRPSEGLLQLEGSMLAYTAGYDLEAEDDESEKYEEITSYSDIMDLIGGNSGWAADLGATYQLTDKMQLGLGILDLGTINWKNGAREYSIKRASTTFQNLDEGSLNEDNYRAEAFADSVAKYFEPQDKAIGSYRTGLPVKSYLNITYELHRSVHASGIFFSQMYKGRFLPGFTAAINKEWGRRLGTSLSYTAINGSYSNVGAGFSFRLTPFQLYVVSDNVLGGIDYKNAKNVNVRAGLNLVFGTIKKPTKLPY